MRPASDRRCQAICIHNRLARRLYLSLKKYGY